MKNTWVDRLIEEYSVGKKELEEYREKLDRYDDEIEYDAVTGMIGDMKFALEWMKRGRRPGNRRGAEIRDVYQRTALVDPQLFPSLDIIPEKEEKELSNEDKRNLVDILWLLSSRERQCYLMHMAYGMSYSEIARELHLSRNSVRTFVDRAKEKIKKRACS